MTRIKPLYFVLFFSLFIAISLAIATWHINPWPTDAEEYYMPAAKDLSSLKYLSQMHQSLDEERIKWLHGKELHVLGIWFFQQLLADTQSLRPLMLLGITSILFSSILVFLIANRLWGQQIGLASWFLFTSSFWPYLYILFAKHQTQGLLFFLTSIFFIIYSKNSFMILLSGLLMGVSLFSSTVSTLYLPYIFLALWHIRTNIVKNGLLFGLGITLILLWVNYPDVIKNIKNYLEYIRISSVYNHFYYNQRYLVQWIPSFDLKNTRGGWSWIIQYFFLVMPVVFPIYILSIVYLLRKHCNWKTITLIILSFSSPILAEIKHVAQYGANYFTSLMGILLLISVSMHFAFKDSLFKKLNHLLIGIGIIQLLINLFIFTEDIYPARLSTTMISSKLSELKITKLFTPINHPLTNNIIKHLNPETLKEIQIFPLDTIARVSSGYILLPPPSTDSIYRASNGDYSIYADDLVLNQIIRKGKLKDYAVCSFKTLSSSLIWSQEEEILAYRYLVLKQFEASDLRQAWLLDSSLIQKDLEDLLPNNEDLFLFNNKIQNIGTITKISMYKGYQGFIKESQTISEIGMRVYKVGDPKDSLTAYVFKVDDKQPTWIPASLNFRSTNVSANNINSNPNESFVVFSFSPPVQLNPGGFLIVVYRTDKANDANFYRIWTDFIKVK